MKAVINALADVPEGLRGEYEEKDGRFVLKVEGQHPMLAPQSELVDAKNRIAEFRDKNIDLLKTLKTKEDALAAIDPTEATKLRQQIADLEGQVKAKGATKNEELLAAIQPLKTEIEQLRTEKAQETKARKDAERATAIKGLENSLAVVAQKAGVDERAVDDFVHRGMRVFQLDDEGKIVAKVGGTPVYSKKEPGSLMTIDEWAPTVKEAAPHLFKPSTGGGAAGGAGNGGAPPAKTGNPNAKPLVNPTPQDLGRYMKEIASGEMYIVSQ